MIRKATQLDLDGITAGEAACFPPAEAATREQFAERLCFFPDHFWMMVRPDKAENRIGHTWDGQIISFVNGFVTDEEDLVDEMFSHAMDHNEQGKWQMIFGVDTLPEFRHRGYAGMLIRAAIEDARRQGRSGVVLTCKDERIGFYEQFGFRNEGPSQSTHGGAAWNQMRIRF